MSTSQFALHAHFHQPSRGNPFDGDRVGQEEGAAPYLNWNERILAECYRPNAELGNFEMIGFDVAPSLLGWMRDCAAGTYDRIRDAHRNSMVRGGAGNGLPVPMHHTILPLASARDKATQIRWGLAWHRHHLGGEPAGMWLPELAVDLNTLQALHDAGLRFTVLSQAQIHDGAGLPDAGPYWVGLPNGGRIAVYVRDDALSNMVSFELSSLGGAGHWARHVLAPRRRGGPRLVLIATDGETFGHHHRGEEHFLHWLMRHEATQAGFIPVTLSQDFQTAQPVEEIRIRWGTSWTCPHGIARWSVGCACTPGVSSWKGTLWRAFNHLLDAIDAAYDDFASGLTADPWALRDDFIGVAMGAREWKEFLSAHQLSKKKTESTGRLRALLWAEYHAQRIMASAGFHVEDPDRLETRVAIANAARAAQLAHEATGQDFGTAVRRNLEAVHSERSNRTGAHLFDEIIANAYPPMV